MSLSVVKIEREEPVLPVLTISHSVKHPAKEEVPGAKEEKQKEGPPKAAPAKPLMPPQEQGYLKYNEYDFF